MGKLSQKVQIFIFGASIGLIVASLFFIFKLDNLFSKVSIFESGTNATVHEEEVSNKKADTNSVIISKDKMLTEANKKNNSLVRSDSSYISSRSNFANENDAYTSDDENINVLKEELLSVKNITLKDFDGNQFSKTDSVLYSESGIQPNSKTDLYLIEFWKTPLNSKGYKMTRNRILIYGIKENQDLCVAKIKDNFYLKNNTEVYQLNYSSDFKPMIKVNEESIIKKFN
jgi:hypothetical protein